MRGASGTTGPLIVVAVLASGEHPKPQPSLDVTCCGLGTWRIDPVPSWYRHCHLLLPKKRPCGAVQGVGYISTYHRNTIVFVNWYPQCHLLLPQSDLVKLCMVLVEEKCSKRKCKKYPSLCFATTGFGLSCGCFDSLIPTVLCQAKPNYSVLNQQLLKNIIPENFPIQPQLSCSCIPKFSKNFPQLCAQVTA